MLSRVAPFQKESEAEIRISLKKLKLDLKGDELIIASLAKTIFGCLACHKEEEYDGTVDIPFDQYPISETCFHTVNKLKVITELEQRKVEINCTRCGAALDYSEVRKIAGFSTEEKMKVELLLNENYLSRNSLFKKCPKCKRIAMREDQNNLRVRCVICPKFEFCWQCLRLWPRFGPITSGEQCGRRDCEFPLSQLGQIKVPDYYTVKVMKSTVQFYKENKDQAYRMSNHPKGSACIINVKSIKIKEKVLPFRHGTDVDADKLQALFKQLCFDVTVYDDFSGLTAHEIVEKLKNFAGNETQKDVNCCVVCILSHGAGQDTFYGTDGEKVSMDTVLGIFDNENCPALKGTPKLFFVQFCRGKREDSGVQADSDFVPTIPTRTDMLIGYPTEPGYVARRHRERGSWYIQTLVWVFMKYACLLDVCAMLNVVNKLMMNKVSEGNKKQMSLFESMLTEPHLFLFPGITENNHEAQQSNCDHWQS